jgi:hypothetical protein
MTSLAKSAAYAVATVTFLIAGPCLANPAPVASDRPVTLAQIDVQVGPQRDYDRDRDRDRVRHHREGCRDVTVRERRGDETVVRHIHRCD